MQHCLKVRNSRSSCAAELLTLAKSFEGASGSFENISTTIAKDGCLEGWMDRLRAKTPHSIRNCRQVVRICALQRESVVGRARVLQLGHTV